MQPESSIDNAVAGNDLNSTNDLFTDTVTFADRLLQAYSGEPGDMVVLQINGEDVYLQGFLDLAWVFTHLAAEMVVC